MISLQALCNYLDDFLQNSNFIDYCPNGLQIEGKPQIKKIATAVSANLQTIETAINNNADALIVHHGIFWNKDSYCITGIKRKKLDFILKNNISLLAYHLPLDAHQTIGNNWKAAMDLDWENLFPFGIFNGSSIGVKGSFNEISIDQFIKKVEAYYKHSANVALGGKKNVTSAAIISGGAHTSLTEAAKADVDCFITGNFDEPAWNIAYEESINFLALGHHATERIGPWTLGLHLAKEFHLKHEFIDSPNPF